MLHKQEKIKTEAVSFRLDVQLLDAIRTECSRAGVNLSEGIRQILQAWNISRKNKKGSNV